MIGLVLSLTRSSVSSEIKTLHDGHHVVLPVQHPWMSVLFILPSFSANTGFLRAALLLPLSFRVGLLLAALPGSSLLGEKSIISWDSSAGNLLHLVYVKLSLLWYCLNLRAKGSTILIVFSTCMCKVVVLVSADDAEPWILAVLAAFYFQSFIFVPHALSISVFWNC